MAQITECSRLEQRSVIKFLVAQKCKQYETYRRMCNMYGKACFSQTNACFSQTNELNMDFSLRV